LGAVCANLALHLTQIASRTVCQQLLPGVYALLAVGVEDDVFVPALPAEVSAMYWARANPVLSAWTFRLGHDDTCSLWGWRRVPRLVAEEMMDDNPNGTRSSEHDHGNHDQAYLSVQTLGVAAGLLTLTQGESVER